MGVPPIACDASGPPTFIDGDPASPLRMGWLVPPDDEGALAQALVAAACDASERALRGANGRAMVTRCLTWPAIARDVATFYDQVAPVGRDLPAPARHQVRETPASGSPTR